MTGGAWLRVGHIGPGETGLVEHQGYTHIDEPEKQQPYDAPDPWPEDRERYREFLPVEPH